ncbi:hypothetical protein BUALT_Bualt03G0050100 [Buddleja alternifolia]|uniref:Negative regulator of systemic acquired resistance SNI1 n=1 Tax=Buddleja alternifolia TaxID=168488 RepID=A0AAV6XRC9_9LAMI|nr:hypothetical protein BUALT_Bualt03G0050100 [Buddleja alternifolia]
MERRKRVRGDGANRGVEENTMAILDTSGFNNSKISHHLNDDRLAFLEAVRTASLLPDNGSAPTGELICKLVDRKMFDAIFHILKDVDSLDLIIESYQLLVELDKRFPQVYLSKGEHSGSSSPSKVISQLVAVEEAWLPFNLGLDSYNEKGETKNHPRSSMDSSAFHALIQEVGKVAKEMKSEAVEATFLKNMLLLQYLITVLEGDFLPRNSTYQESMNWTLLRESLLNMLLGSRKILYKGLIKDCLFIMCHLSQSIVFSGETSYPENSSGELSDETSSALALALPEVKKSTCTVLKKLLSMIMELDSSRQAADQQGLTTRADGVRTPVVFDPKWKLEIIIQYFQKYIPKSSVQTRRSSATVNIENFDGVLKCLSNRNSTKSIIKKISTEVVQLLLAYAFQAYLAISYEHASEGFSDAMKNDNSDSVGEVCNKVVSAFTCLRQEDPGTEILSVGKEALFTAATILLSKS